MRLTSHFSLLRKLYSRVVKVRNLRWWRFPRKLIQLLSEASSWPNGLGGPDGEREAATAVHG